MTKRFAYLYQLPIPRRYISIRLNFGGRHILFIYLIKWYSKFISFHTPSIQIGIQLFYNQTNVRHRKAHGSNCSMQTSSYISFGIGNKIHDIPNIVRIKRGGRALQLILNSLECFMVIMIYLFAYWAKT